MSRRPLHPSHTPSFRALPRDWWLDRASHRGRHDPLRDSSEALAKLFDLIHQSANAVRREVPVCPERNIPPLIDLILELIQLRLGRT